MQLQVTNIKLNYSVIKGQKLNEWLSLSNGHLSLIAISFGITIGRPSYTDTNSIRRPTKAIRARTENGLRENGKQNIRSQITSEEEKLENEK